MGQHEAEARAEYVRRRRQAQAEQSPERDPLVTIEVREVGICVLPEAPWLAGSPDGVCWENGVPSGLLEVKTGQTWCSRFEEDPIVDWLYQVHGCMRAASAALGVTICWCDLF